MTFWKNMLIYFKNSLIIHVSYLYTWWRFPSTYMNFNFDFLDLHNVFFENYFANELTRSIIFEAI